MKLHDLLDADLLEQMVADGYVRVQTHTSRPLAIYNYSEKAQYERVWNDVTRQCRGLIVNTTTGTVIGRPFPKFFNYGETEADALDMDASVVVTDKADGSLGILYPNSLAEDGHSVATRGSFTSEQAKHATAIYRFKYQKQFRPKPGKTYLFEIVYPSNRIVLDYGDMNDLIHLGTVDIETGKSEGPDPAWPGPIIDTLPYLTLAEALEVEPRPNAEGMVIHFPDTDRRVKIKQDDYLALHRILTGVTARSLWEFLAVHACIDHVELGKKEVSAVDFLVRKLQLGPDRIAEILAAGSGWKERYMDGVPDEFAQWVDTRVEQIKADVAARRESIMSCYMRVAAAANGGRREFVQAARAATPDWQVLMRLMDGMQIETWLWSEARPEHERPFRTVEEAA